MYKYRAIAMVKEVKGTCAAGLKKGDQMVFEGSKIVLERTTGICTWAVVSLSSMIRLYFYDHIEGEKLKNHIHCPDPGIEHPGGGGSVIFELTREKIS
jgi:uncharacterized repeat protein (TIGR04076 family)